MAKIDKILISGFKKFEKLEVKFNKGLSVFIGENESGKSTIFQAINIVINQADFGYDIPTVEKYFNSSNKQKFLDEPKIENLPAINIELYFDLSNENKNANFYGLHYSSSLSKNKEQKFGIVFKFEFDKEYANLVNLNEFAKSAVIPIEYYSASWNTFQGKTYKRAMSPLKLLYLDNSNVKNDLFGGYARQIYKAKISEENQRLLSANLNQNFGDFQTRNKNLLTIKDNQRIGFDASKSALVKLLDIYESDISIQDMGRGRENFIKTEMALHEKTFDVILVDEPEIHLSHGNTRKLIDIISSVSETQITVASHHSLVVSRLNLKNAIWFGKHQPCSLKELDKKTALYFEKLDNLDILRFIISEKIILVEGHAEYIAVPAMFKKEIGESLDKFKIDIISMGSISYRRYKEISEIIGNKVLVLTDNDEKTDVSVAEERFSVWADKDVKNWTFEVAIYNCNADFFDKEYANRKTEAQYKKSKTEIIDVPKALAHMLKYKTSNAIVVEESISKIEIPNYLKEAFKWISE